MAVERGRRARLREGVAWGSSTRAGRCAPYNDFALYPQVSVLEEPHLDAGFLRGQGAKGAERSGVRSSEYGARALAMSLAGMCSHILQKPEDQVLRRYPSGRESSTTASRISGTETTTKERQRGAAKKHTVRQEHAGTASAAGRQTALAESSSGDKSCGQAPAPASAGLLVDGSQAQRTRRRMGTCAARTMGCVIIFCTLVDAMAAAAASEAALSRLLALTASSQQRRRTWPSVGRLVHSGQKLGWAVTNYKN